MPPPSELSGYIEHIEKNFCPYISASKKKDVFRVSECRCEAADADDVANFFLRRMIDEVDVFRTERAEAFEISSLVCRNVVLHCGLEDASVGEILGWTHYALKKTFARVGVVFGKFYRGHGFRDARDRPIPDPSLPFISVRTVLEKIDPVRFYNFIPDCAPQAAQWQDDLSIRSADMFRQNYEISGENENWYAVVRNRGP